MFVVSPTHFFKLDKKGKTLGSKYLIHGDNGKKIPKQITYTEMFVGPIKSMSWTIRQLRVN